MPGLTVAAGYRRGKALGRLEHMNRALSDLTQARVICCTAARPWAQLWRRATAPRSCPAAGLLT